MTELNYDKELGRILEAADSRQAVRVEPSTQQVPAQQAMIWPWQVPQVPTITSNRTVSDNRNR
jgi:hypothetical protein